jgi:DNA-binding beta-propeller fold protein YncE
MDLASRRSRSVVLLLAAAVVATSLACSRNGTTKIEVLAPPRGALNQLAGTDACVSTDGSAGACEVGVALGEAHAPAVSRDGLHVYVASREGVAVFTRDTSTGALQQLAGTDACVSDDGTGPCEDGTALLDVEGVAVSRSGKHVYVVASRSGAIASFTRDESTGALEQLAGTDACISEDGTGGLCETGVGLGDAGGLAISGNNVYVASELDDGDAAVGAIAIFRRDGTTGALEQLAGTDGCVSHDGSGAACEVGVGLLSAESIAVSGDGDNVYAAGDQSGIAVFKRRNNGALDQLSGTDACVSSDGTGGVCRVGTEVANLQSIAVRGANVYVSSEDGAVAVFRRKENGALRQLAGTNGCVSHDGSGGACEVGIGIDPSGVERVALSPDGANVYAVSGESGESIAIFKRKKSGALDQLAGTDGCVSSDGSGGLCETGIALGQGEGLAFSPNGKSVYLASNNVGVAVFKRRAR